MSAMGDAYFTVRQRKRKCRFCGEVFTTSSPAKKTCDKAECAIKSQELVRRQNAEANARYQARKRKAYVMGLGR